MGYNKVYPCLLLAVFLLFILNFRAYARFRSAPSFVNGGEGLNQWGPPISENRATIKADVRQTALVEGPNNRYSSAESKAGQRLHEHPHVPSSRPNLELTERSKNEGGRKRDNPDPQQSAVEPLVSQNTDDRQRTDSAGGRRNESKRQKQKIVPKQAKSAEEDRKVETLVSQIPGKMQRAAGALDPRAASRGRKVEKGRGRTRGEGDEPRRKGSRNLRAPGTGQRPDATGQQQDGGGGGTLLLDSSSPARENVTPAAAREAASASSSENGAEDDSTKKQAPDGSVNETSIADTGKDDLPFITLPSVTAPNTIVATGGLSAMLCKACRNSQISNKLSCEARIKKLLNDGMNLTSSLKSAAMKYPTCRGCHPSNCQAKLDREVGFDKAAPRQLWGTIPTLRSLPKEYRIPQHVIESNGTEAYFRDWPRGKYILHTYNPSLVPAPPALKAMLPRAMYVAVFRLSPLQTCTPVWYPFFQYGGVYGVNLYGFAALDERLEMLRDVIVDVNSYMRIGAKAKNNFEDVRLQYIRGNMYLTNGRRLMAIELKILPDSKTMPNMFGGRGLYVKNLTSVQFISNVPTSFKNSHVFEDASKNLYLDYWPEAPHEVRPINFRPLMNKWLSSDPIASDDIPEASFQSHSGLLGQHPFVMSRARGSACCLEVKREEYQDVIPANHPAHQLEYLLVGISHSKSAQFEKDGHPGLYLYLSRLYAFSPSHPFATVARSGFFCLSDVEEPFRDPHGLFQREPVNRLSLRGRRYRCPRVHFVSGMTESATNSSEVIVAYGINDCVPRFAVLEKHSMIQRLFLTLYES